MANGRTQLQNKVVNSIVGGAIGDALGAPLEFGPGTDPGAIQHVTSWRGCDGMITDDTQMVLFTLEACLERLRGQRWDLIDYVWEAYRRWYVTQTEDPDKFFEKAHGPGAVGARGLQTDRSIWSRRAPGNTCLSALAGGKPGQLPPRVFPMVDDTDWQGPINDSKGCGGVMRVAPIAWASVDPFIDGCRSAALTHGHPDGWLPAGALARMLLRLTMGDHLDSAITDAWACVQKANGGDKCGTGDLLMKALLLSNEGDRDVTKLGEGWVGDEALAIGVLAAHHGIREGVMVGFDLAVNHAGDSDSTGSIAGQIMGAAGVPMPEELAKGVEFSRLLHGLARDLVTELEGGDHEQHK
jgi:ADP-ribosylglycohydrolase